MTLKGILTGLLTVALVTTFTLAAFYDTFPGDRDVLQALRVEDPSWRRFFAGFDLGPLHSVGAVLVVMVACLVMRKFREGLASFLILPAMGIAILVPKVLVDRPRPPGELEGATDSFPSGTAATSIIVLGLVIYFVGVFVERRYIRLSLQLLPGLAILALGIFRVLAGEHWPSDLVGGYMSGGLALIAIIWAYHRLPAGKTESSAKVN